MTAPIPTSADEPRFPGVSRRAFLRSSALVGLAAAAVPVLAACGDSSSTSSPTNSPGTTDAAAAPTDAATSTTSGPSTEPTVKADRTAATDAPTVTTGQSFPAVGQVQIDFTYAAAEGGRVHSPYIAVWIEDTAGELVQAVSLWYKSDEGKYLKDLKRWNSKNNRDALMTGPTRIPGSFSVAWNGTDLAGASVAAGDYFVCIEAARENGPYQIVRESVPVSGALAPTTLTPNGELTAVSVHLVA